MAKLKDNQMLRGLNQALYRYLPERWIDFYIKESRLNYSAKVIKWNSLNLTNINVKRLLRAVNDAVRNFRELGNVKGFGPDINPDTTNILTPKCGDDRGIIAEVNPLTFFCSNPNCKRVYSFKDSHYFLSNHNHRYCNVCKSILKQIRLIYICECGWAGPVKPIPCKEHMFQSLKTEKFAFICSICGKSMQMIKKCESCGKILTPKNVLDSSQYYPFSLNLVDLVDEKREKFLSEEELGKKVILAYWLGMISREEFNNYIKNGVRTISDEEKMNKFNELFVNFVNLGISEEDATKAANVSMNMLNDTKINDIISDINHKIVQLNEIHLSKIATSILEYDTILYPQEYSTLESAMLMAKKLNTNAKPEVFKYTAQKFGISHTQVSGKVPFIFASYGYTRKEAKPQNNVCLHAFPEEIENKKNVYATKLETEGVLFEIDRKKIMKWLLKNNIIEEIDMPNVEDDADLKLWFLNTINIELIKPFDEVDEQRDKVTSSVFKLIHSISHALIKQAAEICGLDKNSLSEYIFPNIPGVFIYCQNSQGFNLGALFNTFEAYFDRWIINAANDLQKCVFDPICIDRDKACPGCIYLNEVSCVHFNKDLDRRLLIGWYDKINKNRIYGFWEER